MGLGGVAVDECLMELVRVFIVRHPCADEGLRVAGELIQKKKIALEVH